MTSDKEMQNHGDDFLEDFFAAARAAPAPPVPEALMARVLQQAEALQPRPAARRARKGGAGSRLRAFLGGAGWAGQMAGLAAAALAGVWMGFVQPTGFSMAGIPDDDFIETIELFPNSIDVWAQELGVEILAEDER